MFRCPTLAGYVEEPEPLPSIEFKDVDPGPVPRRIGRDKESERACVRRYRAKRYVMGLCVRCPNARPEDHAICDACRAKYRAKKREQYEKDKHAKGQSAGP